MSAYHYLTCAYNFNFSNLNILECGSYATGSETEMFRKNNNCYYVEANPSDYASMLHQPGVNKDNIFNFALFNNNGKTTFTVSTHPGNSSIAHSDIHRHELQSYNANLYDITVDCITYPHFIRNIIKTPIDVLVLDIEGGECEVLKTMADLDVSELPKFIVIEAGYDWLDRKKLLIELGYTIDFYQFNNVYLTHSTFNVHKLSSVIHNINNDNKQFIWHGQTIFVNDLI